MPSSHQESFIANLRGALGYSADTNRSRREQLFDQSISPASEQALETIRQRSRADRLRLLEILCEQAKPLNLTVTPVTDMAEAGKAVADLVASTTPEWGDEKSVVRWPDPLLDELDLESALGEQNVPVTMTRLNPDGDIDRQREVIRKRINNAYVGVTAADFCLADTATLVMKTRENQARSVSLVPSIHVAVVRLEQLLADLKEMYALLRWDEGQQAEGLTHHMVMISGPSKTADIELVMVHGAHGPRAMHLIVITG